MSQKKLTAFIKNELRAFCIKLREIGLEGKPREEWAEVLQGKPIEVRERNHFGAPAAVAVSIGWPPPAACRSRVCRIRG